MTSCDRNHPSIFEPILRAFVACGSLFVLQPLFAIQTSTEVQNREAIHSRSSAPALSPGQDCGAFILIEFHQKVLSESDGPRSHFYPSSSEYTKQAIKQHGLFTGIGLGCDRLLRENSDLGIYPLMTLKSGVTLKYDPIPAVAEPPPPLSFHFLEQLATFQSN